MADELDTAPLESLLSQFENTSRLPEVYLKPPQSLERESISTIKRIFDFCKKDEANSSRSLASTCPLQELFVDGFDAEQIWQEIDLQNVPLLQLGRKDVQNITQISKKLSLLKEDNKLHEENSFENSLPDSDSEVDCVENSGNDDNDDFSYDDDSGSDNDFYERKTSMGNEENRKPTKSLSTRKSEVDDSFFKLSDMIKFLDQEDRRFERAHKKNNQEVEDDNEEEDSESELIDYFIDMDSSNGDEEDKDWSKALEATEALLGRPAKKKKKRSARFMKYAEFFDPPDGEEMKSANRESDEDDQEMKDYEEELADDDEAVGNDDEHEMDGEAEEKPISNFQKKQEKVRQRIEKLEAANIAPKPWQMMGEAGGNVRPLNSLLEEDVSFDHTTATAPDITEETTQQLEDIIKQRIKDEAWDDVERKVKPVTEPYEYKKQIPLDHEKSKLSLSQIYEQEYLKQTQVESEEKVNEAHEEIKTLMNKLFIKLDALANFHFTPKAPKPELKVVTNTPVISMEEVAPVTVSDAMMLAPEEVHEKKKEQKGTTELTETDRKRERRAKKRKQHEKAVEKLKRRKLVEKLNPGLGNKYSKEAALKRLEKDIKTSKNVSLLKDKEGNNPVKSSTAFFSRLQDEVRDQVNMRNAIKKKQKSKSRETTVTQLKL
ncbi:U3 small nucleolar ribonucleoprotein protein MPP10-like [Acropora muricata]|uniref:U3 small nucleolar ribonucleoprotein protein MPP10-like n=1 Tax=Acropora muricata TaxID=159855 RepID=UPI0034E49127